MAAPYHICTSDLCGELPVTTFSAAKYRLLEFGEVRRSSCLLWQIRPSLHFAHGEIPPKFVGEWLVMQMISDLITLLANIFSWWWSKHKIDNRVWLQLGEGCCSTTNRSTLQYYFPYCVLLLHWKGKRENVDVPFHPSLTHNPFVMSYIRPLIFAACRRWNEQLTT